MSYVMDRTRRKDAYACTDDKSRLQILPAPPLTILILD